MRLLLSILVVLLAPASLAGTLAVTIGEAESGEVESPSLSYGENAQAGSYARINGINMYYEIYGAGEPLLLIHGNGQSIAAMQYQARYFADDYTVIVADSRGHGKSGLGDGRLTYEQMADDWKALLEHLEIKTARILGWSDGGNIGLLLAIHHPNKVAKLAIMGANLQPDNAAVYPWAIEWVARESQNIVDMLAKGDDSQDWQRLKQHFGLLREQPNIPLQALGEITAPVLVMAGDRDVIRAEHTLLIF